MVTYRARHLFILAVLLGLLAGGCSPESARVRGGGMGADVGNRYLGSQVDMHGQLDPLYNQPVVGQAVDANQ